MVIPGAGRNGDSYRDSWVEAAEKYNCLILSPMYSEEDYPFEGYHLCGLIKRPNTEKAITFEDNSNVARLNESVFHFELNPQNDTWLFEDFDRIFDLVLEATGSRGSRYDLFGHLAGGQILHRLALFKFRSKAQRIVAVNSGFYTLPDLEVPLPFGMANTGIDRDALLPSFQQQLTLLIGELDNAEEQGGTLLRPPSVDQQGTHRPARGKYFFEFSKKQAKSMDAAFNWDLVIVPGIGHDQRAMAKAPANFLFEKND